MPLEKGGQAGRREYEQGTLNDSTYVDQICTVIVYIVDT